MAAAASKTPARRTTAAKAAEETPPPEDAAGATPDAEPEPGSNPEPDASVNEATGTDTEPGPDDPASQLKALRAQMQTTQPSHPGVDLTSEQRARMLGVTSGSVGGSRTLVGGVPTPRYVGQGYSVAERDGYIAWIPKGSSQPITIRVWVAGHRVRNDMLDALKDLTAETAVDAPVLDADTYQKVAQYL